MGEPKISKIEITGVSYKLSRKVNKMDITFKTQITKSTEKQNMPEMGGVIYLMMQTLILTCYKFHCREFEQIVRITVLS